MLVSNTITLLRFFGKKKKNLEDIRKAVAVDENSENTTSKAVKKMPKWILTNDPMF